MPPLTPDSSYSTLSKIKTKIRRLTRSLSTAQLSEDDLDQYINTFVLYDFPEHVRLFNLKTVLTFFTKAYVDTYATNTTDTTDPLYNFKNRYITVNPPVYVAGYQTLYTQSRDQFYSIYPMINSINSIGTLGDGVTTAYAGNINTNQSNVVGADQGSLIVPNSVLFDSIDVDGVTLTLIDFPSVNSVLIGYLGAPGSDATAVGNSGQINYVTGDYSLVFPTAPAAGAIINSQVVIVQPSMPQAVLFYNGEFIMRPIPDQAYRVTIEAYMRPTEMLAADQLPELSEFWQYISLGSAIKVFQDRMDMESVAQIMPEFRQQQLLITRRTIVQQTNQRVSTIYTQQSEGSASQGWFAGGSGGQF